MNKETLETKVLKLEIVQGSIQLGGGFIGGIGNYYLKTISVNEINHETGEIPVYGFLGALAGVIGVTVVLSRVEKNLSPSKTWGRSIACGLTFPLILSGIADLVSLKAQVYQLQAENIAGQEQSINALRNVAEVSRDPQAKTQVLSEIAQIAERSAQDEIIEQAIEALDDADDRTKNSQVLLNTIASLEKIALKSDDSAITQQIINELLNYKENYSQQIAQKAETAIMNIRSKADGN